MHSTRARLAACTALVLSAGMLLATPVSADEPTPHAAVEKPAPAFTPPTLTRPSSDAARAGAAAADGATAAAPQLSDFDGDGISDLIYRAWSGDVYTATSTGAGGLVTLHEGELTKDIVPIGNQGGDTSGPEVLMLSEQGVLSLYRDMTPSGPADVPWRGTGWQTYNKIVSPGDVNADGRADLLGRDHGGSLYLYLGTGDVTAPFTARVRVGGGWNIYDQLVGVSDNNGDGKADLYGRDTAGALWFYPGTGDPAAPFASRVKVGSGWSTYNQIFPVGDDNGDGHTELIARDTAGTLWYYLGRGDGTLGARSQSSDPGGWDGVPQFGGAGNIPVTGNKEGVLARDKAGTMFWYGSRTTGKLASRSQFGDPGGWAGVDFTHLSSLNPDGSSDIAEVFRGDLYIQGDYIGGGWGVYNTLVGAGDLSGDGKGDLLARDGSGTLYLYRGNGQGTAFASRVKVGGGWGVYNKIIGAGDYTNDGRTDIVARTSGGDLYVYPGTGVAATPFKARVKVGTGWNTYAKLVAPGDLNADGKGDLLGVTSAGDLYSYLNTSASKFTARAKIGSGFGIYNTMS
ncbi:FG-GAP-like repeat-containing protein [Streptomyces sp. NPDC046182]|uniref:FG-GAP-like repeat-containing protein n=1 Tax=Streptomyces sp. NPDC046182 TaxID=3154601 RepID=UPI0033FC410F